MKWGNGDILKSVVNGLHGRKDAHLKQKKAKRFSRDDNKNQSIP